MSAAIQPYTLLDDEECEARILAAREALGERLVILCHHYQRDEVFQHAIFDQGCNFARCAFIVEGTGF